MSTAHTSGLWKVSYDYVSPASAGPFKGSMTAPRKYSKGDEIRAPFGLAVVRSCRAAKTKGPQHDRLVG